MSDISLIFSFFEYQLKFKHFKYSIGWERLFRYNAKNIIFDRETKLDFITIKTAL